MSRRVLIVEDEPALATSLGDRLASEGYDAEIEGDGARAFSRAREEAFDLIVLDVMLPGKDGFSVCRDLRGLGVNTPVLMLTARGQTIDRVLGLKLGADDYLTKPFEAAELLARVEALLRRAPAPAASPHAQVFHFGAVKVDTRSAEVTRGGSRVELLAREYKLLCHFVNNRGAVLSRDRLLNEVWGYDAMPTTRTVDVHVAGLRQKLEDDPRHPRHIITVHGLGYKFVG